MSLYQWWIFGLSFLGGLATYRLLRWLVDRRGRFCRHDKVQILRVHPESSLGRRYADRVAWTDHLGVHNLITCCKCGEILDVSHRLDRIYGEP